MNMVLGTLILLLFVVACAGMVADVNRACDEAQRDVLAAVSEEMP